MTNSKTSVLGKAFSVNDKGESEKPKQDIRTPKELFEILDRQFHFDMDPCDSLEKPDWLRLQCYNLDRGENGLELDWFGRVFVNPPWGKGENGESLILTWILKAEQELRIGNCRYVVFLVPSRTETKWFHHIKNSEYLMNHTYLKSRVKFDGHEEKYVVGISIFTLWRNLF